MFTYYKIDGKIVWKGRNCDTKSTKFYDNPESHYEPVTKTVKDKDGKDVTVKIGKKLVQSGLKPNVERFESEENLPLDIQPTPQTPKPKVAQVSSPDGTIFDISVDDLGAIQAKKAKP